MVLLALLVCTSVVFWIILPEPLARNVPAVAKFIRRAVLYPPQKKLVWTAEDRVVQQQLETMLAGREPPMRMVFDRGKVMDGRVVEERPDSVVFAGQLGLSGEVTAAIDRERIVSLGPRQFTLPEITLRDVRFRRAFPDKQFYIRPPFTILTEESFFSVERIIEQQQILYDRFVDLFRPLLNGARLDGIQLLILSSADEFELCRLQAGGVEKGASGFYSILENRLIVLQQRDAEWVKDGHRQIAAAAAQEQKKMKTPGGLELLRRWKNEARSRLDARAGATTQNILRHEGTHHLCYSLGVLNRRETARGWVSEGLATWFETGRPGTAADSRVHELKEAAAAGKLLSLEQLTSLSKCTGALQYAQAWALTNLLMQPEYRSGFFAYLAQIRQDPAPYPGGPVDELCRFLTVGSREFERRWMDSMRAL